MKKSDKDPAEQIDPFEEDHAETVIEDPIDGVVVSEEFKRPKERAEAPIMDGFAARWQEHSFANVNTARWVQGSCVELARFVAPPGTQGRVSVIETSIVDFQAGITLMAASQTPWYYDWVDGFAGTPALSFYLRLQSYNRIEAEPAPLIVPNVNLLPGVPHPDLGEWRDARYEFARHNVHVSLFVPEGLVLRMFCALNLAAVERIVYLYGRLAGITQHYRGNPSAVIESCKWPG